MIDQTIVVDAVGHAYNWKQENWANELAEGFTAGGYGFHHLLSPDNEYRATMEEWTRDWQADELEEIFFKETVVDVVSYHGTPLDDYFHDGLVAIHKGFELKQRNPDRVFLYGPINPLEGDRAIADLERQVSEYGIDGVKLYPARYYRRQTLPVLLDDPQYTIPVIERALELGVNVIAVHKAIPFGPTASVNYRTDDVDVAAALYPEMNFEIVHAGYAFLEDTLILAARFPNVWANLEITASMAVNNPRRFADAIGGLLYWGAGERTMFASGCTMVHPQPAIEALMNFQVPQDMIEGYGYPQITDDLKRKILGENFLRLHGVDQDALKAKLAGDKWSKARESGGLEPPWHNLRQNAAESPRLPAQTPA